jgi:hypothetical protein
MNVEIPTYEQHGGILRDTYQISDYCPACGGLRGKPFRTLSYDGSASMEVDGWINECGHVDTYSAVRVESALSNN